MSITRGYLEYRGGYSVPWGIQDARGRYHEYHGAYSVLWGKNLLLFEYPSATEHPHGTHDIPTRIMLSPHGNEYPSWY